MNEVKDTLRRLAVYYLLMAAVVMPATNLIPNSFPVRNISSLVLMALSVCLYLRFDNLIVNKGNVKSLMLVIAAMLALLFLFRGMKYTAFTEAEFLKRLAWYLYYVPLLLIPQFFFFTALCIHADDTAKIMKKWMWTMAVSDVFILFVLTNDLHRLVFGFKPDFENWDSDYSHGIIFYLLTVWQYSLHLAATIILFYKCRRSTAREHAYLILIPFLLGAAALVLLFTGKMPELFGEELFHFPEVNGVMVACIMECCMSLGLIPTNESHKDIFAISSVAVQITDKTGTPIYKSAAVAVLPPDAVNSFRAAQTDENTILRKIEIPGGCGFWQEDISELNRVNEALAEAKEKLSEESNLIHLQNELQEKQRKIEQRIQLYDEIARRTVAQSRQITILSDRGLHAGNDEEKDRIKRHIVLLGVYIKRYANLMILAERNQMLNIAELGLSLAESLHYLEYYGIPGQILNSTEGEISSDAAITIFAFYEAMLEEKLSQLAGVYINISRTDKNILFKLNYEGIAADISDDLQSQLKSCGISLRKSYEDDVTYITLALNDGGEDA